MKGSFAQHPILFSEHNGPTERSQDSSAFFPESIRFFYFATFTHLYQLAYERIPHGRDVVLDTSIPRYQLRFGILREIPCTGPSWFQIAAALVEDTRSSLFSINHYDFTSMLGHFSCLTSGAEPLDVNTLVLLRPSHTPSSLAQTIEEHGENWYLSSQVYQNPSSHWYEEEAEICPSGRHVLFDVFIRGRFPTQTRLAVRLSWEEALHMATQLIQAHGGIALHYESDKDTLHPLCAQQDGRADGYPSLN